ncbi:MAG: CTP synthase [Clostridia bacterium]
MDTRYIIVTGGVVSGLGKGITAASLGRLLKDRGLTVSVIKLDPYLNVDPGTMNPTQHGEVFVTEDGAETDLDLGHYERFIDENLSQNSNITSGQVYLSVIHNERKGNYGGQTVQIIPHITDEIKRKIALTNQYDVVLVEIGGTVGDMESQPFIEAIRQFTQEYGSDKCMHIHVTLVPYLNASQELKTKPTQHSVKELLSIGIQPDVLVLRTEKPIDDNIKKKISLFCNVPQENVIENGDMPTLYEIPIALEAEGLAKVAIKHLNLECGELDFSEWSDMVTRSKNLKNKVNIALVGKYVELHDSYLSVVEALKHGGIHNDADVHIEWIDSETVTQDNVEEIFKDIDGVLVPGGFGSRGIDGKILAAKYARENKVPYLGICLGMQIAIIEFARNVLGFADANSSEIDPSTTHPVIDLMDEQKDVANLGGTMRLGSYPCVLKEGTKGYEAYAQQMIHERHRHRYEVNNEYREQLEKNGMILCGVSPDKHIVEMCELADHPWYVASQAHPEFKSRPTKAHPLFAGFIKASIENKKN